MEEIKLNMENLSDEERKQLMALVEKANKLKNRVWKPGIDENFYFLGNDGMTNGTVWKDFASDDGRWDIGNVFRTEEEAEEEAMRLRILTKWKRLSIEAGEEENEWNSVNCHWHCYSNYTDGNIDTGFYTFSKTEGIYFPTEESLLNAIKEIGEDNVKKYILNIEE